ncbi:hypothetical protein YC2023_120362 [Brassica napus]
MCRFGAFYGNDTSTSSGNSTSKIKRCSGRVERSSEPAGKRPMSLSNIDLMERSKVTAVVSERFCGAGERSRSDISLLQIIHLLVCLDYESLCILGVIGH